MKRMNQSPLHSEEEELQPKEQEEKEEQLPKKEPVSNKRRAILDPPQAAPLVPIHMADQGLQGNAMFENHLKYVGRTPDEVIARVPRMQDVMAHIAKLEDDKQPVWFRAFPQLAIRQGLELPVLEVVTPEYVADFLREPKHPGERRCCPPLHPYTGERLQCESVLWNGVPLREFLLPSQKKRLYESPFFKNTGRTLDLPKDVRPCFLCCQRQITVIYGLRKFSQKKRGEREDEALEACTIIHDYIMAVGYVGAYRTSLILSDTNKNMGIAGPLIAHDRDHYAPYKWPDTGLRGWLQRDEMFFRDGAM